jgi:hypothetical protein
MRLTAAFLGALKLDTDVTDKIFFDTDVPGFGLRVRASGGRTWIFQYKVGGRTRRLVLGNASAVKPARAREIASELHAKANRGKESAINRLAGAAALVRGGSWASAEPPSCLIFTMQSCGNLRREAAPGTITFPSGRQGGRP